ncbi:hypothetical protein ACOMHN_028608 [Nucella lapillus]
MIKRNGAGPKLGDIGEGAGMGGVAPPHPPNASLPGGGTMTRVQTNLKVAVSGLSCSFEVFGFNEVLNGRYYTSGVEISFAIGDFANQIFRQEDIIKFDVNQAGVQSSTGDVTVWGSGTHSTWKGVEVTCSFDDEERFVIFEVPRCHFRVKFRPFDPQEPQGPQSKVPAISIVAGPDTIFGETELGRYPASVCGEAGRQGDGEFLYLNRQRFLSLKTVHEAILFDALNQNITQESVLPAFTDQVLQDKLQCQEAVDEFLQCGDLDTKIKAIQLCARILTKRRVGLCVGIEALKAFTGCVQAVCSDKVLGCDVFRDVFEGQSCVSVRRVNQFCSE